MKTEINGNQVGFKVKVYGKKVKEYTHKGDSYIWARKGTEYSILIWNNSPNRVEAVVSVDGIDVINGKTADLSYSGYVVDANSSIEIPGYLLNGESAAKFTFGTAPETYAALTDRPENIGVIGVAFYEEKQLIPYTFIYNDPWPKQPYYVSSGGTYAQPGLLRNASVGGTYSSVAPQVIDCNYCCSEPVGTIFGDRTEFKTEYTTFERQGGPKILNIYYKTKEELKKMGIRLGRAPLKVAKPQSFPTGCKPPEGWNG